MKNLSRILLAISLFFCAQAFAGTEGSISGTVADGQGVAVSGAPIKLLTTDGKPLKDIIASATGDFTIFPVQFGDYQVTVQAPGFSPYQTTVHVASDGISQLQIQLQPVGVGKEMVIKVQAKRHMINTSSATSSTEVTHEQIEALPEGDDISLPKLLGTTTPGVVQGPFNQTFIRGNHANIQYQIDGVQLPDSVSGEFAEAFSPRNIDHFEMITGGIPAEYGERLAAVVNIATKAGPETPGGSAELNYGSYNTFAPQAVFGGSNANGDLHYFLSANYKRTDRGLDTPQPSSTALSGQGQGGEDAVHDESFSNNQFLKLDWLPNNDDKVSLIAFHNHAFYQIPNYPSSFSPSDPYFGVNYTDAFGNQPDTPGSTLFNYAPAGTDDTQTNEDAYGQVVWKHSFNEKSFLQLAPYWKYSQIQVTNDLANDLAAATEITGANPSSFALNRHVNNEGLKADYSQRTSDTNLVKAGFQVQSSQANDDYFIASQLGTAVTTFTGGGVDNGYLEALYLEDDLAITKRLSLNAGIRFTGTQFQFQDADSSDSQFQPRIGVNFMLTEQTKLHAFYGRLFMPAPLEDLRTAFDNANNSTTPSFYDIKAEKDNYYEVGIDQQIGNDHLITLNTYYKDATDMLDDTQLLNTAIASPYNYADGYAYGVELSAKGRFAGNFSDFFNYSYEIAKGENISGGTFAVNPASIPANTYLYLDHVQVHTANAGVTYATARYFGTVQGLYGSGLRTGPNNADSLPGHLTFDLTAGYTFDSQYWVGRWKVSGDILNVLDNPYPITIANGFNGSHYAAGREFFIRLTKEL